MILLDELREAWRSEPRDHQLALVSIVAIAVALRVMYISQPMRYDEAVTYMHFVRLPWVDAISTYTYPNNHVFHTLLVKASVAAFGDSPWVLRVPAFLAGIVIVPATYAVARAIYRSRPALIAAALVATSGVLVLYSTNARGYSLVVLAFLLLVLIAIRLMRAASPGDWVAFVVIAVLGLWTIPVMLFPLGTVVAWFSLVSLVQGKRAELRQLLIALCIIAGLTLLAYAPVIFSEGLAAITRNRFVAPSGWPDFLDRLPRSIGEALASWHLGLPVVAAVLLLLCAVVALGRHRSISSFPVGIPLAALIWSATFLVVSHRAPFPRVWLWFLPIAASLAAAGLQLVLERWARSREFVQQRTSAVAVAIALGASVSVATSFQVLLSRDTGTFRDAEEASVILARELRPGDRVLAGIPSNGPLDYYLHRQGVDRAHLSLPEQSARRILVLVDAGEGQTLERMVAHSEVRDSGRFTPASVVANFPTSAIYIFRRRDAPAK